MNTVSHNWLGDNTPTEWRVIEAMECKVIPFQTAAERDKTDADKAEALLSKAMEGFHKKLVVLDDDPTGVLTGKKNPFARDLRKKKTCFLSSPIHGAFL